MCPSVIAALFAVAETQATKRPINRCMDKEAVVHMYSGILLSHEKEHISVSSNKVDEPKEQTQNVAEIKERKNVHQPDHILLEVMIR